MAEYYPLLERAVAGLPNSTPEVRKALYERARTALLGQLRISDPPVPESDIERESVALDEAIARVEAGARSRDELATARAPAATPARTVAGGAPPDAPVAAPPITPGLPSGVRPPVARPRPAFDRPPPGGAAPPSGLNPARERPAYPFRNLDPGAGATRPIPPVRPNEPIGPDASSETAAPRLGAAIRPPGSLAAPPMGTTSEEPGLRRSAPQPPGERPVPIEAPEEPAVETPAPESAAEAPDPGDQARRGPRTQKRGRDPATRPAVPVRVDQEPRRRTALYAMLVLVLLLAGAVGVTAYVLRDRPEQIVAARPDVTVGDDSPGKVVNRAEAPSTVSALNERSADQALQVPAGAPARPASTPPADTAALPSPIPQGSERASRGPQTAAPDEAAAAGVSSEAASSAMPAEPSIGVAQRAGMLVDAPEDPQKVRTFSGTVVWRMESVSAGQGQPLSNAIRADVEIPEAKVAMSMVLKRNVEPQFPASHTIELHFVEQPGNSLGPVKQINVPELRREDSSPAGDALAGVPVSITDDYFLVGLSRGAAEASNMQLLTQRNWIDVSIMLSSGKIAKVAFEKGAPGQKILEDALASWH